MLIRSLSIVIATGLILVAHSLAVAHTDLLRTEPESGTEVDALESIELYFVNSLESAEVRVLFESNIQPSTTIVNEDTTHVTARLDDDPEKGIYQVVWTATAADDQHTISGSFSFEYDPPPTPNEMRAGIILIAFGTIAFIAMLVWQRRIAAIKAMGKVTEQ